MPFLLLAVEGGVGGYMPCCEPSRNNSSSSSLEDDDDDILFALRILATSVFASNVKLASPFPFIPTSYIIFPNINKLLYNNKKKKKTNY